MEKGKMKPHNLDVQRLADMLERDKCPASMGAFIYPDGSPGVLMILAQPKHESKLREFLQKLYDSEGYVSPKY